MPVRREVGIACSADLPPCSPPDFCHSAFQDVSAQHKLRKKDGKHHRYFSVVENRRVGQKRMAQRTVLYLGEINDSQQAAWRKTLEVFDESSISTRP